MRFGIPTITAVFGFLCAVFGVLWFAGGPANPWRSFAAADEPVKPKEVKGDPKADHPTVAALRSRLMTEFHGRTSDVFTSVTGFGFERMVPVYERIPWEVPHFSTNDVEVEIVPATPQLLKDVFAKSLDAFKNPAPAKPVPATSIYMVQPDGTKIEGRTDVVKGQTVFNPAINNAVVNGVQLRLLDLIGVIDPDGPKVYSGGKAFELVRSKRAGGFGVRNENPPDMEKPDKNDAKGHFSGLEERPLDLFESAGLAELSDGKETFVRTKDNVVRMLGALRAGDQCLKCHTDHRKGDLLGALSYTFFDTNGSLKLGESKAKQ